MMRLGAIYKNLSLISPYVEVMLRKLYWKNVKWLGKYNPNDSENEVKFMDPPPFDFSEVISFLKEQGVKEGDLLIVHSSFDKISGSGLKPYEIISRLRCLIGDSGTLAMPVIRIYKDYPQPEEWLKTDFSKIKCTYDPRRTPVSSGLLPSMLMREKGAVISMHPLNTMAAVGPLAQAMMEHNLDGDMPSPHGPGSSWKFCADNNAIIVSLGVNMVHHLTIAHVAEDCFSKWPYKDWYNELVFNIVLPDKSIFQKTVRERKPKWGLFYDAELNFENDLRKSGIMHTKDICSVPFGVMKSNDLLEFIRQQKNKAYPYYKL